MQDHKWLQSMFELSAISTISFGTKNDDFCTWLKCIILAPDAVCL